MRAVGLTFFCFFTLCFGKANAGESNGPDLTFEKAAASKGKAEDGRRVEESGRTRATAHIYAPLPQFGTLSVIPSLTYSQEQRDIKIDETGVRPRLAQMMSVGAVALTEFEDGGSVTIFNRYSDPKFSADPMYEWYFGVYRQSDTLSLFKDKKATITILGRTRFYPSRVKFLFLAYYKVESDRGLILDLGTSHLKLGYRIGRDGVITTGLRADSRDYPISLPTKETAWQDGHSLNAFIGYRQRLWNFVHAYLEGGYQSEGNLVHYESPSKKDLSYSQPFVPWIGVSLQTVFESQ